MAKALHPDRCVSRSSGSGSRFERCDPEEPPASELLAAMRAELNDAYDDVQPAGQPAARRRPSCAPPGGAYLVGYEGDGGRGGRRAAPPRRRRGGDQADVRAPRGPLARRGGGAAASRSRTTARVPRATASARLDTGPKQVHALAPLPRRGVRRGAAVQRQPVRLLLGREAACGLDVSGEADWATQLGIQGPDLDHLAASRARRRSPRRWRGRPRCPSSVSDPHAVAAGVTGRARPGAPPARARCRGARNGLVDRQLVEEHLGALVGVRSPRPR